MQLQAPPFDAAADLGADWLELRLLSEPTKKIIFSDIERAWEARRETEETDYEGRGESFDDWLAERVEFIQVREKNLKDSYPFVFGQNDCELVLKSNDLTLGQHVYLLCLFLSAFCETELFIERPRITDRLRDLFQSCSAWAAAGAVHGSAYALGWPRQDGSPFLKALKDIYEVLMNDGEAAALPVLPAGSSHREKDGGVDVVAWRERIDSCAGKIYLLGQVASGKNWRDKSIEEYVGLLHNNWFSPIPVSQAMRAMFIPFSIVPNRGATRSQQLRYDTARFGNIYYREVLPAYAAIGIENSKAIPAYYCDRKSDLSYLQRITRRYVRLLERAQVAA